MQLSLKYLIKKPQSETEKAPLILLLHGYGSNAEDLFSFVGELPENAIIVSAQAPYDLQYGSYAWYAIDFDADENKFSDLNQARISRDLIAIFIDELLQNYAIDKDQVTLIGFSQGTILSYAVALSYPEKELVMIESDTINSQAVIAILEKIKLPPLRNYCLRRQYNQSNVD